MPTFRSIGLHPDLYHRLVTTTTTTSTSVRQRRNGENQAKHPSQPPPPPLQAWLPMETPQALLSRNPQAFALLSGAPGPPAEDNKGPTTFVSTTNVICQPIPIPHVLTLRAQVAAALVEASVVLGTKHLQQQGPVSGSNNCATTPTTTTTTTLSGQKRIRNSQDDDQHEHHHCRQVAAHQATDRISLFPGSLSAWDWLQQSQQQRQAGLSTGCTGLDHHVSLSSLYNWSTPWSATSNFTARQDFEQSQSDIPHHSSRGGIPFGYVTQLAGPPGVGKTQMALHVIAHATCRHSSSNTNNNNSSIVPASLLQTWYLCSHPTSPTILSRRLAEIILTVHHSEPTCATRTAEAILDSTHFVVTTNEYEVLAQLAMIEHSIIGHTLSPSSTNRILLVLDSVSGCLASSRRRHRSWIALTLKRLARQYGLAVLFLNGSVGVGNSYASSSSSTTMAMDQISFHNNSNKKPALGPTWNDHPAIDIHIWLDMASTTTASASTTTGQTVMKATVLRHPTTIRPQQQQQQHPDDDPSSLSSWRCVDSYFCITKAGIQTILNRENDVA